MFLYLCVQFWLTRVLSHICVKVFLFAQTMRFDMSFLLGFAIGIIATIVATVAFQKISDNHKIRDHNFLTKILKAPYFAAPISSLDDLVHKVAGDISHNSEEYRLLKETVQNSIVQIKSFFEGDISNNKALCLDGVWGSGKTSSVLLAIDMLDDSTKSNYRFIYESATRYIGGIYDYERDVISSIGDVCAEKGIYNTKDWRDLLSNIGSDNVSNMCNIALFATRKQSITPLTTEVIASINDQYYETGGTWQLVIILDDIDRLPPEDVYKAITFLSILRRFHFARIVVPADKTIIQSQLNRLLIDTREDNEHPRGEYIAKYLPEQSTIKVHAIYQYCEKIVTDMVKSRVKSDGIGIPCAVWAAMLIKVFSLRENKIEKKVSLVPDQDIGWNLRSANSSLGLKQKTEIKYNIVNTLLKDGFEWTGNWTKAPFEDIVYKMKKQKSGSRDITIRHDFDEDFYTNGIASWIFEYAEKCFSRYPNDEMLTFRTIINIFYSIEPTLINMTSQVDAFVTTFNALFPTKQISLSGKRIVRL